jgi:hypothetical protein
MFWFYLLINGAFFLDIKSTTVTIKLGDINDNSPVIDTKDITIDVYNNKNEGVSFHQWYEHLSTCIQLQFPFKSLVLTFEAPDADSNKNSEVTFTSTLGSNDMFKVNEDGLLTVNKPLGSINDTVYFNLTVSILMYFFPLTCGDWIKR